jgi:KDO2-lipid IV(A) lauroyltransferase
MKFGQRLEYTGFMALRGIILSMPLKSAQQLGAALGGIAFHVMKKRRLIALDNLRQAFPEKSEKEIDRIARGSFRNYAITMMEFLWAPNFKQGDLAALFDIENFDLVLQKQKFGKGVVILSGHYGNWEVNSLAVGAVSDVPITIISQTQANTLVDAVVNRHRSLTGNKIVPMGVSVREVMRALQKSEIVGILPDQSGPEEGPYVEFFGRNASTHQGPAVFALRTDAPMLYSFNIRREDGTYRSFFEEVRTDDLKGTYDEKVLELTRRHIALLEHYIRLHPDHWQWMHRRWKHLRENTAKESAKTLNHGI